MSVIDAVVDPSIEAVIEKEFGTLEKLYTSLHASPELSRQEVETAKRMAGELRAAGYEVAEKVGGTGVVGLLKNGAGKRVMIRAELDALPVREQTGVGFASAVTAVDEAGQKVPVMHACGHDMHMTVLVGVARALVAMRGKWRGTVMIVVQPAEEILQGARAMLEDGVFERFGRPDFCLSLHVDPRLAVGKMGFTKGNTFAHLDSLDIVIRGLGGHGAAPHTTKDPVVIAAQAVLALQTIVSREVNPTEPVVVTAGTIHGGTKRNIIPDEVKLELTVRTYSESVRAEVLAAISRIVKGVAMAAGVPEDRMPVVTATAEKTDATFNTPALVERVVGVLRGVLGEENVVEQEPTMGSEDFGMFGRTAERIPIFMMRLGSVSAERVKAAEGGKLRLPGLHASTYLPEREGTIRTGILGMVSAAVDLLGG